jgi:gamma-glutamylcyclotransferase (GGCT)/AIG2-like uncharacterized protein YtfP
MSRRIAVYGTLRKGYGLNEYVSEQFAEYEGIAKISGFKMFSFDKSYWSYPVVTPSDNMSDKIEVELYKFHDNVSGVASAEIVDDIELGAAYYIDNVEINGKKYDIYLQPESIGEHMHRIHSGDFNEFSERTRH